MVALKMHFDCTDQVCGLVVKSCNCLKISGAGDEIRTHDIFLGKEVLYH